MRFLWWEWVLAGGGFGIVSFGVGTGEGVFFIFLVFIVRFFKYMVFDKKLILMVVCSRKV